MEHTDLKCVCKCYCQKEVCVDCVWSVMAHMQKPDFVFWQNGRVHLNRWGRQCVRLLAAEVCGSAVVILDTPCSEVVWRVLATHCIRQFPCHFPSRAWLYALTFQLDCTAGIGRTQANCMYFELLFICFIVAQTEQGTGYVMTHL